MPDITPLTVSIPADAVPAYRRMARALDGMLAAAANNRGRYETATNAYEADLEEAFTRWAKRLGSIAGTPAEQKTQIAVELALLSRTLQDLGQETLPDAIYVLGHNYIPGPDAFVMIADAIRSNTEQITTRLLPDLQEKLVRAVDEDADLVAVAQSLLARVTALAGLFWATVQRAIGDFARQAATADDEVYECRWVLDAGAEHCEACAQFAGTYASYDALLEATGGCVPGYFFGYPGRACWANCRCHLELKINGVWVRV